jgi:uncharacterized protein YbcC (UPF0753/DUF2309 family)
MRQDSPQTTDHAAVSGSSAVVPPPNDPGAAAAHLQAALHEVAHYLPAQAPLEVFVHHNTLHAFQHLPFHEALQAAQRKLGARGYLSEERYRAALRSGRISDEDLERALAELPPLAGAWVKDFPYANLLRKLVLVHGVRAETPTGLCWQLSERQAGTRFRADIPTIASARILADTERWLRERLAGCDSPEAVHALIAQIFGDRERATEHLGSRWPTTADQLARQCHGRIEAVAVAALWTACREVRSSAALPPPPTPAPPRSPRDSLLAIGHEDPDDLVHPILIPLCAAFLDRGQSHWPMPERDAGFFRAWCRLGTSGLAVRPAWLSRLGKQLRRWLAAGTTAEQAVLELLAELAVPADRINDFIEHTVLRLPGWAGMFHRLESAPGPLGRSPARVALLDFVAVRLTLDVFAYRDVAARLGYGGALKDLGAFCAGRPRLLQATPAGDHDTAWPLFQFAQLAGVSAPTLRAAGAATVAGLLGELRAFAEPLRLRVWQEAYEAHYRDQILAAIDENRDRGAALPPARLQMIFCIDDRAESLRRHLEELSVTHETFGAAGFFNLAIAYQGLDDPSTFPLCPVVVEPRHRVQERPSSEHLHLASSRVQWRRRWGQLQTRFHGASRSLLWGSLVTAAAGALAAVPLLATVFAPWLAGRLRRLITDKLLPAPRTHLTAARAPEPADGQTGGLLFDGFTVEEQAERVGTLLANIGLTQRFAPLVVVFGHDSSSVNNPHFAAYSCGACGGRSGGPNARLFAHMANRPEVRALLRARGIQVPDGTVFVGGVHDTCNDSLTLFDVEAIPAERLGDVEALRAALDEARRRNAHERCRRFGSAPADPGRNEALHHVEERAFDLSQARPELGHATNAACVVGRRTLTRGLFLDRRPFLVSYDPEKDPSGAILERTLLAVGPVGAGINLEYFFSAADNERLGAGTKLPHNVTGLLGVMNGASSDLRTGLPLQMIEIHEPVRLQLFIESTPAVLTAILDRQPAVAELVLNEWVRVAVIDPDTGAIKTFSAAHGFQSWQPPSVTLARVGRSVDFYRGRSDFLPPALLPRPTRRAGSEEPPARGAKEGQHDV